jgi:hypothetical protein
MRLLIATSLILGSFAFGAEQSTAPQVGQVVPVAAVEQIRGETRAVIKSSPSQFYRHFVLIGNVRWDLGVSEGGEIKYVSTKDPRFKTAEGVSTDMQLSDVQTRAKQRAVKFPRWAWVVELPSGWKAAFVNGRSKTEEPLLDSTPISFLYRDR